MFKDYKKHRYNRRRITVIGKLQSLAFTLSIVFLIIASISAYFVFMEGRTAQINAQKSLNDFEQELLKTEIDEAIPTHKESLNTNDDWEITPIPWSDSVKTAPQEVKTKSIAKIQIEKLDLDLSVLSEWNYKALEISVCKFIGPEPNEPGNFVIIGHNYKNGAHFGRLSLLDNGDLIDLTDLSGRKKTYEVYEKLTIESDEIDKLSTNETYSVTLVTCTSKGKLRLVIKCKEVIK